MKHKFTKIIIATMMAVTPLTAAFVPSQNVQAAKIAKSKNATVGNFIDHYFKDIKLYLPSNIDQSGVSADSYDIVIKRGKHSKKNYYHSKGYLPIGTYNCYAKFRMNGLNSINQTKYFVVVTTNGEKIGVMRWKANSSNGYGFLSFSSRVAKKGVYPAKFIDRSKNYAAR